MKRSQLREKIQEILNPLEVYGQGAIVQMAIEEILEIYDRCIDESDKKEEGFD